MTVRKENPRKRGPKSFVENAKLPRKAGYRKRIQFRKNKKLSRLTMKRYRTHFKLIFSLEGQWIRRSCKGLRPPHEYDPQNQHGGVMPALPGDFRLSDRQAGKIMERVSEWDISYDQFRGISGMFSHLFAIETGQQGGNYPEVKNVFGAFDKSDFEVFRSLIPTSIPQPSKLKTAFTKPFDEACGMTFAKWCSGLIATWCWCLFGCRPGCDIRSLKFSTKHTINLEQGWACTAYLRGRNKLCGRKKFSRPWNCFFICNCPNGKHVPVSEQWAKSCFNRDGSLKVQPNFTTECPLNCLKLKEFRESPKPFHLFSKWCKTPGTWSGNWGDPVKLAIEWLDAQGASTDIPYDSNAGRKACSGMLTETKAPFPEGFEIHGDHPDVWIPSYQPSCPWSDFSRRTQSGDPRIATTALRRFTF